LTTAWRKGVKSEVVKSTAPASSFSHSSTVETARAASARGASALSQAVTGHDSRPFGRDVDRMPAGEAHHAPAPGLGHSLPGQFPSSSGSPQT
jgi:hypothetical protein